LSPLAGLTCLKELYLAVEEISDISPLAGLTGLTRLALHGNDISDISALAGLTKLKWLNLHGNNISDISVLAGLTKLEWLDASINQISDVSPILGLTNLTWLSVARNQIADFAPLQGLREKITLIWLGNPAISKEGGPKIEGPWLWVVFPDAASDFDNGTDLLSKASDGTVTEAEIATHGATESKSVGEVVWNSHNLPPTGDNNINDTLKPSYGSVIYGTVSLYSPREQKTTMYVGNNDGLKVWVNGALIYKRFGDFGAVGDYNDFVPVTLKQGKNVLLVAVLTRRQTSAFFGFEPGTDYTVSMGVGYTFSKTPIHTGDTFTLDIRAENVFDLAGWQFDIAFDKNALEAINVSEGDFLKQNGASTFFQGGSIDNAAGKIGGLNAARLAAQGATGTGSLLQVSFKAKSGGETKLTLQNFQFGSVAGDSIPAGPHEITITVEGRLATGDVNRDGQVSILDLILVSQQLGKRVAAGSPVDVNGDGVVSILDLITVSGQIGSTTASAAPPNSPAPLSGREGRVDAATVAAWIAQARMEDDGSHLFKRGIENLERLLAALIPEETALLANYPNPFNPETWIPYQLAEPAEVTLTIYDINGQLIRRLAVGHQAAGMYRSRDRAVYWDGRNQLGESVTSGLYFYTLTAGDFTATRRMLILK
ncbi:T9SS type A sorting domain-containing protein, partial [Candidatus Poribacteria bacterium]|nr:T9SS type A sorting domain-containing protein [Candidatus Poribacteria bacterium]